MSKDWNTGSFTPAHTTPYIFAHKIMNREKPMKTCAKCNGKYTEEDSTTRLCKFCKADKVRKGKRNLPQ